MLSELLENNKSVLRKTNSYMLPQLDKIIHLTTQLETMAGNDYIQAFKREELPKGAYLQMAGSVCRHLWFLETGIARVFVCKKGIEKNQYFFFPSEVIDSFCNTALQTPSRTCIQLLEDSIVHSIPISRLDGLRAAYPLISDIEKLLQHCHTNWVEERLYNLLFLTASEHYQYLMATQPYVISHISQNHLASFLDIARETLSRVRSGKEEMINTEC